MAQDDQHGGEGVHFARQEIARYLLARGIVSTDREMHPELEQAPAQAVAAPALPVKFPDGLAPAAAPITPPPDPLAPLPQADVVVVTWTVDETDALARVFTPGQGRAKWHRYAHRFHEDYDSKLRRGSPAAVAGRLGSYMPVTIGTQKVLCIKSELHMNQDGITNKDKPGTATLPVKDFFKQIIAEAQPKLVLTVGTAGSTFVDFALGDVVVTRAARFRCQREFRNEPFNETTYKSDWQIPTGRLEAAEELMQDVAEQLLEPPVGPPTKRYDFKGPLIETPANQPAIRLDGRDMPDFHPILTTDYFEYGTSSNHLEEVGAGVEMGDAALGLACDELPEPPQWAVVRNMSDPVINGDLPAGEFYLNQQTTWAVGYYTAYGLYTSIAGALATWGIIAGRA
jgi:hypothetical protein